MLAGCPRVADNEIGINEVLKMRDTKHNCSCLYKCQLEVQLFELRLMPAFLKFRLIFLLHKTPAPAGIAL